MVVSPPPVAGSWPPPCGSVVVGPPVVWVVPVPPPARPPRVEAVPPPHRDSQQQQDRPRSGDRPPSGHSPDRSGLRSDQPTTAPVAPTEPKDPAPRSSRPASAERTIDDSPIPPVGIKTEPSALQPASGSGSTAPPLPPLTLPDSPPSSNKETGNHPSERIPPPPTPLPPPLSPRPAPSQEPLPPLTLPPEIPPIAPPSPDPPAGPATSRYRPTIPAPSAASSSSAALPLQVTLQAWKVPPPPGGYRLLRFLNYTDRPLVIQVEGQEVKLPARSQLPVWVGPQVRWSLAGEDERHLNLPETVGALDIAFRSSAPNRPAPAH